MEIYKKFLSDISKVSSYTSDLIEEIKNSTLSIDENIIFDIKLVLDEALTNAIKYGNKLQPEKPVEVNIKIDNTKIQIEVRDWGEGFDYKNLPDPTVGENLEKTSGRGVFLIRNLMDHIDFLDGGSKIRMVKFIEKGGTYENNQ